MSPTPVTYALPDQPASYSWEATDEEVAARYGVDPATIVRFDLNTSPTPPRARRPTPGRRDVRVAALRVPAIRLPAPRRSRRRDLRRRDRRAAGRGRCRRDPRPGRQGVPAARRRAPSSRRRATRCTGSSPSSAVRPSWPFRDCRRTPAGRSMSTQSATAAAESHVVWLCSPNNPTGLAEPDGAIAGPPRGHRRTTPPPPGAPRRSWSSTRRTRSSSGRRCSPLRVEHPNLVVVRTASKAYALAGLRVGFAIARPETIARIAPYRPPGSVATTSVTIVTEALRDPAAMRENLARVERERERLAAGLTEAGWRRRAVGDELPAGPASRIRLRPPPPPRRSCGAGSCHGRSGPAIRSRTRCASRSATRDENDRLIEAAGAVR